MKTTYIPLVLSVIALLLASSVYLEKGDLPVSTYDDNPSGGLQGHSSELIRTLDRLERRISGLESSLLAGQSKLDTPVPGITAVPEREMAQMQEVFDMFGGFSPPHDLKRLKSDPEYANAHFIKLKNAIDDSSLSENERLDAIQSHVMSSLMLNMGEAEAEASVAVALDIALASNNAEDQVRAWEILTGVGNDAARELLTEPLLGLAVDDENPYLRKLAVQGLQHQLMMGFGTPGANTQRIKDTLLSVRTNDSSPDVRRQAERGLSGVEQMQDMIKNGSSMAIDGSISGVQNMLIGDAMMYTDDSNESSTVFELVAPGE
ncbi:MAG: hypothetical protein AB8B86_09585 [Pseudomonadales bacterium]